MREGIWSQLSESVPRIQLSQCYWAQLLLAGRGGLPGSTGMRNDPRFWGSTVDRGREEKGLPTLADRGRMA